MAESINNNQVYGFLPTDIEGVDTLASLALDLRWSWNHAVDEIWYQLDADLWMDTHNPWVVLQNVSREKLMKLMVDQTFRKKMDDMMKSMGKSISEPAWFQKNHPKSSLTCIAYFSMEFMLSEALPIYVGGLGNVAGDQLKSASDLGVPVVAVGLLYQQGYFRQIIDQHGTQQALFPYNDPGQLPISPLRLPNGEWLRFALNLGNQKIWLRTWQVQVGRVKLYLMDSNDPANSPIHRAITSEVYGGGSDLRIQQEIILGIGGCKLLQVLNIKPEVYHMNEGHAAFLVLERASAFIKENGVTFEEALFITRAGNLFTSHTAVAAGFDHFNPSLMWRFFGDYAKNDLGIDFNDLLDLGRKNPLDSSENFNMAFLAIHGSGAVNGVSRLHGEVSRQLFKNLFPRWTKNEIPIGSVTNGVHMPSWDSEFADKIWTETCGKERWRGNLEKLEGDISGVTDAQLWQLRNDSRNKLVNYARERFAKQVEATEERPEIDVIATDILDSNTLTLGFARRFVPYKRPNLLLHDPERFIRILTNPERPVQLVIAGKSPPFDESGKAMIRQWIQFIQQHNLYHHVIFLSDYDMLLAEHMVQGTDVWINTPRHPWEACGTSGMKVLVNGGINLSELDGWWAEAYSPEVGWALGDTQNHDNDANWDAVEADSLYRLLEQEVVPAFYNRNNEDIPEQWIAKMRNSISTLTPKFSANRAIREYTEEYYIPAATNYQKRAAKESSLGKSIVSIMHDLKKQWDTLQFGEASVEYVEGGFQYIISVSLKAIDPTTILIQLFANELNGGLPEIINMESGFDKMEGVQTYHTNVCTTRPANDYTVRIIPNFDGVSVPLEVNLIRWQH
ncbi:alpha-glucan family phosphorylase [Maribacter sp. ACAM166]|uniref:alpha-glucan family phosphorylase n=1 Tax=Maribacter sp. ACAM166 TaxID=2508996 RepID=UPI0010FF1E93|nr:alpha-glucan family phosphorylase [Maribacter sp. ACAM166]TLP74252.1 glycosyltransferase family 1 protein [Maribacter sp. ACAM166]